MRWVTAFLFSCGEKITSYEEDSASPMDTSIAADTDSESSTTLSTSHSESVRTETTTIYTAKTVKHTTATTSKVSALQEEEEEVGGAGQRRVSTHSKTRLLYIIKISKKGVFDEQ